MPVKEITKEIVKLRSENGVLYDVKTGEVIDSKLLKSHRKTHEYRVVNVKNELASGIAINTYEKTAVNFLKDLKNYNKDTADVKKQIDISNKMYRFEDVVSTGLEILIDFTISGYEFSNLSDKLKPLIDHFDFKVNNTFDYFVEAGLQPLLSEMASEYFISGNIFPVEEWDDVTIDGKTFNLPVRIKLLNPNNIEIDETAFSLLEQKLKFTFGNSNKVSDNVFTSKDIFSEISNLVETSPIFIKDSFKQATLQAGPSAELNNDFVSHIKRNARTYDAWGTPYLTKLAQAVTYKQKLWQLDLNTIDGLMNYITVFKIGSPDKDSPFHIPPASRLQAFAALIKNPQASTAMVWPHDIDIITSGPDGKVLNFADKYKEANRAIIQGLGVPPILIDGSGTATAAFVTILALNKRLEKVRTSLGNYVSHLIVKIAQKNNLESELTGKEVLKWFPSDLRNEAQIKQLLLAFYDRGLLPIKTTHNQGGYRSEDMIDLREIELEDGTDDLFARRDIPFAASPDKTPGRPSDVVQTDTGEGRDIMFARSTDIIADKYNEDVTRVLDNLEKDVLQLNKKTRGKVEDLVMVSFVRLGQLAETFSDFEDSNTVFATQLGMFHQTHLENLRKFVSGQLSKVVTRQIPTEEKELLIAGVISQAKKRADLFVKESLRNIDLAKLLSEKHEEGMVGAIVTTPSDSMCEFCKEINNEFFTLSELFNTLPVHPHQRYDLTFEKTDPHVEGKKTKKIIVKDPKNKSRKL